MGMIAKRATARQLAHMVVPVGSWIDDLASCGLPGPIELLAAACYEAVLSIDVGKAKSSTTEHTSTTLRSLLQVRAFAKGIVIGCGAASFKAHFVPDWEFAVRFSGPGRRQVSFDIGAARTLEDKLVNGELFDQVRGALALVMDSGPHVNVIEGPPDVGRLIRSSVLRRKSRVLGDDESPFANDHFLPIPEGFASASIALPDGAAHRVLEAAKASRFPGVAGDGPCLWRVSLSGGRPLHAARLDIVADGAGERIEVVPGERDGSAVGRQRTFRAALFALRAIALRVREDAPQASKAIGDYVDACIQSSQAPDRRSQYVPVWNEETAIGVVGTSATLPLAVTFQATDARMVDLIRCAQSWLLVRHRIPHRETRDGVFRYSARRPVIKAGPDNTLIARLRYGASFVTRPDLLASGELDDDETAYWECSAGSFQAAGTTMNHLFVQGLAQTDNQVAYGAELLALIQAFCWALESAQPEVAIKTVCLAPSRSVAVL
jgi:hypothetical protein